MNDQLLNQVIEGMQDLPDHLQRKVLHFVHSLRIAGEGGVSGSDLLQFAGAIPNADLQEMADAIEAGCEQVDPHEW